MLATPGEISLVCNAIGPAPEILSTIYATCAHNTLLTVASSSCELKGLYSKILEFNSLTLAAM